MFPAPILFEAILRRQSGGGSGAIGCFVVLLIIGTILYFALRGRGDKPEQLGAAKRAMGTGPVVDHTFACPYAKCPMCAASADKMKQQWDGLRKVTWTCGYCGNIAGIQELKDEELPPSARQHLGLDAPPPALQQDFSGPGQGGSEVSSLLTGMMIGSMLNGESPHPRPDEGWGSNGPSRDANSDWGDGGSNSDASGDWGDSGGSDSGDNSGGDSGGSDW
jgi:hypothetical protein